ncbi:MAG: TIGR04211 family SH3 domain-containing protein [Nevskiales bacterium]
MKRQQFQPLVIFLALLVWGGSALAETQYVGGEVKVNMRKGQGTDFAINEILKTDDKVEVLSHNKKSGWSRVRTEKGNVGYILTRFLTTTPPPFEQLANYEQEISALKETNAALQARLKDSQGSVKTTTSQNSELEKENQALKDRLSFIEETSANVVKIGDENQHLRERLLGLEAEVSRLQQQNVELKTWYKGQNAGAVILVIGLFFGVVVARLMSRRRSSAWSSDRL